MPLRHIFLLIFAAVSLSLSAGKIIPSSMQLLPTDMTGQLSSVRDARDNRCALIKVNIPYAGAEFDGVITSEQHAGLYYVWIEDGNKMFEVRFPGCVPCRITFGDLMPDQPRIKAPYTYELNFDLDALGYSGSSDSSTDIDMEYAVFTISPAPSGSAMLMINGQPTAFSSAGQAMLMLPYGTTPFSIIADGYAPYSGQVTVQRGEQANVKVQLTSTKARLTIKCATAGATIALQGQQKSTSGSWSGELSPGTYKIEISKAAHRPVTKVVTLAESQTETLDIPALTPITVSLPINVTPIGATIKIDGKEVGHTPYIARDLLIGTHTIEVTADGHTPYTQTLTLTEGTAPAPLTAELTVKQQQSNDSPSGIDYINLSLSELTAYAEKGDAEAQYRLGWKYLRGDGVTEDKPRGFNWILKAGEQGLPEAEYDVGFCYDCGQGVFANNNKAFEWYLKAAKHGYAKAYWECCIMYHVGKGTKRNHKEALKWAMKYEEILSKAQTCYRIGEIYREGGYGIKKNISEALKWYRKAYTFRNDNPSSFDELTDSNFAEYARQRIEKLGYEP